jgi:DNA-binding CsgD family transcriptional regulator
MCWNVHQGRSGHRVRARSSKTVKARGAVAPASRYLPYTDAQLLLLKQRLREGTRVNRTHALRLLATIDRDRERSATATNSQPRARRQLGTTVWFDSARRIQLTPIQERVLGELCRGQRTHEIAKLLGRSPATVFNHVRLLFTAFGVHNRAALIAQAIRQNVVNFDARPKSRSRRNSSD